VPAMQASPPQIVTFDAMRLFMCQILPPPYSMHRKFFKRLLWMFLGAGLFVFVIFTALFTGSEKKPIIPRGLLTPIEETWQQCEESGDCVEVQGACEWQAIHRQWREVHRRQVPAQRAAQDCSPPPASTPQVALCIQKRCTLIGRETL